MRNTESTPTSPVILLVAPPDRPDERSQGPRAATTFARTPVPGTLSLAATISTGVWPERHGVVSSLQPHPDRLNFELSRPPSGAGGALWTRAANSGLAVGVCNWPHAGDSPSIDRTGRLDLIDAEAIDGLVDPETAVISPGSIDPDDLAEPLRRLRVPSDRTATVFAGLELLADRRPDLLIGWIPGGEATVEIERARFESLRTRLSEAHSRSASLLVLRHSRVAESIFDQTRFGPKPTLEILGDAVPTPKGRPRVDAIAAMIESGLRIESRPFVAPTPTAAGGTARLDAAGIPKAHRIPSFDLRQHEHNLTRAIGACLLARGLPDEAGRFLTSALQTQHGIIDVPVLSLVLTLQRRQSGEAAARLLASIDGRVSKAVAECFELFLSGAGREFGDSMSNEVSTAIGRFGVETLLIDLRRRGALDPRDRRTSRRTGDDATDPA